MTLDLLLMMTDHVTVNFKISDDKYVTEVGHYLQASHLFMFG